MSFDVDRIKMDNDIHAVAGRLGLDIVRGGQQKAMVRCFRPEGHSNGDRTPSAVIDGGRQSFRCWVCDDKPLDVIGLVMTYMGCDFKEACEWLGGEKKLNPKPALKKRVSVFKTISPFKATRTRKLVLKEFIKLCNAESDDVFKYMKSRRINEDVCMRMGLVYCKSYMEVNAIMKDKFSVEQLRKAGLVSQNNENGNLMPFGGRIIYPFYHRDEVVYIQGRSIEDEPRLKKLSLAGTIPCLYNERCLSFAGDINGVCLCEGCEDTLTAITMGFDAVGILGVKGFKEAWARKLKGKKIHIVMDNDSAGQTATIEIGEILTRYKIEWDNWTEHLPEKYDLNDWWKEGKTNECRP